MSDDSGTSDVEQADIECFAALPHDTVQAIGLTANAVRKTIRDNQDTTDVVKYIRFTNVPPAVADKFSLRNTRQMFNRSRSPQWPTVVVEVGVSESYRKLRADADWWLPNSRGDVKLVVIVSVSRRTPNIRFETVALNPTVASLRLQRPRTTVRESDALPREVVIGEQFIRPKCEIARGVGVPVNTLYKRKADKVTPMNVPLPDAEGHPGWQENWLPRPRQSTFSLD
ncbi:hypothetical protein N7535_007276 [Penicillium sp. DV-2018c]|nr:hypothetical protein N7535_007276 [Penicillium sp. DV-2018c]